MKNIINICLLTSLVFILIKCSNSVSPSEQITIKKGAYTGTFSVIFKNYKNYSFSATQSGTISILFTDSTYTYSALVSYSSDSTAPDSFADFGSYSIGKDRIIMNDGSWLRMDPRWHNSLYLFDTFSIQQDDNKFNITQDNTFAKWDLNIVSKK